MLLLQCLLPREIQALWRWIAKLCNLPVAHCILLLVYQVLCSLLNFHSLYKSNFPLTYIGVCLSEKGVQMPDSAHSWLRWQIDWECYYAWGYHVGKVDSSFAYILNLYALTSNFYRNRYMLTARKMRVSILSFLRVYIGLWKWFYASEFSVESMDQDSLLECFWPAKARTSGLLALSWASFRNGKSRWLF